MTTSLPKALFVERVVSRVTDVPTGVPTHQVLGTSTWIPEDQGAEPIPEPAPTWVIEPGRATFVGDAYWFEEYWTLPSRWPQRVVGPETLAVHSLLTSDNKCRCIYSGAVRCRWAAGWRRRLPLGYTMVLVSTNDWFGMLLRKRCWPWQLPLTLFAYADRADVIVVDGPVRTIDIGDRAGAPHGPIVGDIAVDPEYRLAYRFET